MIYAIMTRIGVALAVFCIAAVLIFWLGGPLPPDASGLFAVAGWFGRGLLGDFGISTARAAPAGLLVLQSLAVTLPLLLLASLFALAMAIGLAALAFRFEGTRVARPLTIGMTLVAEVPAFWLGLLLLLVFAVALRWLPAGGFFAWTENPAGAIASLVLPVIALALPFGATFGAALSRIVMRTRHSAPVTSALLRGESLRAALLPHGLRSGVLDALAAARPLLPTFLAATLIVESAFYLPGLGRLIVDGIGAADPYLARAALFAAALLASVLILALDIGIATIDPRLREAESA